MKPKQTTYPYIFYMIPDTEDTYHGKTNHVGTYLRRAGCTGL